MGFFIFSFLIAVPSLILSILAWRLRTNVFFWLGTAFTALLLILYIYEIKFLVSLFANIDEILWGLFFLVLLGLPIFFLVSSKLSKQNNDQGDITDAYLNSIINSKEEEIDFD